MNIEKAERKAYKDKMKLEQLSKSKSINQVNANTTT